MAVRTIIFKEVFPTGTDKDFMTWWIADLQLYRTMRFNMS